MEHHQLFEWQAKALGRDGIPADEAERLVEAARGPASRLRGGQSAFVLEREVLRAQNLVGIVVARGTSCEILPKVDREAVGEPASLRQQLVRMLSIAHDIPVADDAAATLGIQQDTLLEILITRFCAILGDAVRRGVPRSYVGYENDLPALRGRHDVQRQFTRLAASPQKLACRYDEFSEDIVLNQVMKAAVTRLVRLARSTRNRRALIEFSLIYANVSLVPVSSLRWDALVPDRTNARWLGLVRLAKLILGDQFQNSSHGAADGFALLFDMNALFEQFVEKLIRPMAVTQGWRVTVQGGAQSCLHPEDGSGALFSTYPDIQLSRHGRVVAVVDTKWKLLLDPQRDRKMNVSQADIYQLMAYAQLYRCERLVLLYPHHGGLSSPLRVHHRISARDSGTRLTIATIDLTTQAAASASLQMLLDTFEVRLMSAALN